MPKNLMIEYVCDVFGCGVIKSVSDDSVPEGWVVIDKIVPLVDAPDFQVCFCSECLASIDFVRGDAVKASDDQKKRIHDALHRCTKLDFTAGSTCSQPAGHSGICSVATAPISTEVRRLKAFISDTWALGPDEHESEPFDLVDLVCMANFEWRFTNGTSCSNKDLGMNTKYRFEVVS